MVDTMNAVESKHWMRNRRELLAMVVRFNTLSPSSIHPERGPTWLRAKAVQTVLSTSRGRRRVSDALRRWGKFNPQGYYDFRPLHRRFALLEVSTLERLAASIGATLMSSHLSKIVNGDELRQARQSLGNELFDFATKRARFLVHDVVDPSLPAALTLATVRRIGWTQLGCCFTGEAPDLIYRFQLKLPRGVEMEYAGVANVDSKQKATALARKVLTSEVEPELTPCFV